MLSIETELVYLYLLVVIDNSNTSSFTVVMLVDFPASTLDVFPLIWEFSGLHVNTVLLYTF